MFTQSIRYMLVMPAQCFRRAPHDRGHGAYVSAFLEGGGDEVVAEVIGAQAVFDFGADQGVFPGGFDAAYGLVAVADDGAGFIVCFPPGFQLGGEAFVDGDVTADHAAFFGGDDLDGVGVPVDGVPGETQQLHGAGADAQVVAPLDEAHQVGLGDLQDGPGFDHGRRADVYPLRACSMTFADCAAGPGMKHREAGDRNAIDWRKNRVNRYRRYRMICPEHENTPCFGSVLPRCRAVGAGF